MAGEGSIITMVVLASAINVSGTVIPHGTNWAARNHDPFIPIIGGFIVGGVLLGIAQSERRLAESFAAAFLITSALENATPLINALTALTSGGKTK